MQDGFDETRRQGRVKRLMRGLLARVGKVQIAAVNIAIAAVAAVNAPGRPVVRRKRPWQTDPYADHCVRVYESPGPVSEAAAKAQAIPTRRAVKLQDGTVYIVYSDGSFRVRGVPERRPAGLSGRQRRIGRKRYRVLLAAHLRRQPLQTATSGS